MPLHEGILVLAFSLFGASQAVEPERFSHEKFQLEQIDFMKDCNPNAMFRRLVDMMAGRSDDLTVYEAVSGDIERQLYLDEPANWHGLKLVGVHLYFGIERGPVNYSLIFDNRPDEVRIAWNKRGWKLPAVDESREIEGLEGYSSIGVSRNGENDDSARVTCWRD